MEDNIRDTIDFLIRRYRLHEQVPVRLDELLDRFTVRRYNLTYKTLGFAVVRPREIHIGINQNLTPPWQRQAEGHEVGHIIGYHPHRLYTCQCNEWFREEHEHEAQMGAALLLVPLSAVYTYYDEFTPTQLADLLQVPVGLVDMRWSYAQVNGEL
jgi:Zn-dependent peptidase ImmA (M78 family)